MDARSGYVSYSDALCNAGCDELTCLEFYKELFGYSSAYLKYSELMQVPVTLSEGGVDGRGTWRSIALCEVGEFVENRTDAYISPCTYFPKKGSNGAYRSQNGSRFVDEVCAFVLDIDGGAGQNLSFAVNEWWGDGLCRSGRVNAPAPTFIVCSGGGIHLYFVLEQPVAYLKRWARELAEINNWLYSVFQAPYTEDMKDECGVLHEDAVFQLGEIDRHGVVQPYRVVGSLSKPVRGAHVVSAWRVGETYDISDLAQMAGLEQTSFDVDEFDMNNSLLSKERKLQKDRVGGKKGNRKGWNPGFYNWLFRRELSRSRLYGEYGHRYNQVVSLSVAAVKDRVAREKLETDVRVLCDKWNECSKKYGHPPIAWRECLKAMKIYDKQYTKDIRKYKKWWLEEKCGFEFGTQKRNWQDLQTHLHGDFWVIDGKVRPNLCKMSREMNLTGRPKGSVKETTTKGDLIRTYASEHPEANHSQIARALGVSRPTVIKWLKPGWRTEWRLRGKDTEGLPLGAWYEDGHIHVEMSPWLNMTEDEIAELAGAHRE